MSQYTQKIVGHPTEKELKKVPPHLQEHIKNLFTEEYSPFQTAIKEIKKEKHPSALPFLVRLAKNHQLHWSNRQLAVEAIGEIGGKQIIPFLADTITAEDFGEIEEKVAEALSKSNHADAFEHLMKITHENGSLECSATWAIGDLAEHLSEDQKKKAFEKFKKALKYPLTASYDAAMYAATKFKMEQARPSFVHAAEKDHYLLVLKGVKGLAALGHEEDIPLVINALFHDQPETSETAKKELPKFGKKAIELLLEKIKEEEKGHYQPMYHHDRRILFDALGSFGGEGLPALVKEIDEKGNNRAIAANAIGRIINRILKENAGVNPLPNKPHFWKAIQMVNAEEKPNSFIRIYFDLQNPLYKNKPKIWWQAHVKEITASESNLKAVA